MDYNKQKLYITFRVDVTTHKHLHQDSQDSDAKIEIQIPRMGLQHLDTESLLGLLTSLLAVAISGLNNNVSSRKSKNTEESTHMTTKEIQEQYTELDGMATVWGQSRYPPIVPSESKESETPKTSKENEENA